MPTQLLPPLPEGKSARTESLPLHRQGDGPLLARFVARQDEAAFAVLVERHGGLVHGVCRRVLQNEHDVEDAFQATFLVLARKAHTIGKHQSLASWLYKVAYRIALRARSETARRRTQEQQAIQRPAQTAPADPAVKELGKVVDEEVHRLPEKYRTPILLCYLQGQTNEEAAEQLQCPTGTVKIRLMRARELLRKRLARRGLGFGAATLAALLLESTAGAAAPPGLVAATAQAATGGAAAPAAGLAAGALKAMCLTKLKVAAAVLLTVLIGTTADGLAQRAWAEPTSKTHERKLDPVPGDTPSSSLLVSRR